jgi:small subunit ribosomal protein S6
MNYYEHTLIARQDTSPSQIKQLEEKYKKIIENNDGNIIKFESWGLMHLSYLIKKNKKGNYLHFKIEGKGKTIKELEKNEKIDKNLLRYLTVKVKKLDLETDYFKKTDEQQK